MTKILILRFSSIGDIVLTTPVIRCLKQQVPGAEIHFCTKAAYRSLLEGNPYLDKIHVLDKDMPALLMQLKQERFDYVIDLHKNLRTLRIRYSLRARSYSFNKLNMAKWLLVQFKINRMPAVHIVDRYLKTTEKLGVKNDQAGLDFFLKASDEISLPPPFLPNQFIALSIGGQHATKRLPLAKLVELCDGLKLPIVLLGGKEDREEGERIIARSSHSQIFNACGAYSLKQSAGLLKQSAFVISHDTGLMHIAAAFKKKIYAIWGNTVPELGMYPYQTEHLNLEVKGLNCRPCSKLGFNTCPKKHFNCMNQQVFDAIYSNP